jgi:nicotinamide-nucleotide amidase
VTSAGAQVVWRTTVGDTVELITEAIARAMQRADIVLATGGLGPTNDDLTKKAICKYFKRPLVFYDNILRTVENRFKERGLVMPGINQNQALLPQGAEFIENTIGSAVGIVLKEGNHIFVSMPGVPDEMKLMVTGWVADTIRKNSGGLVTIHRKLRTIGIFESALYERIADLVEPKSLGAAPEEKLAVAFLPSWRGVDIRLSAVTRNDKAGHEQVAELEAKLKERIGKYIFGYDDESLPEAIGALMRKKNLKLAVAESCTGGLLGKLLTDISGSSDYFVGGIISYSNDVKIRQLGVPEEIIARHGAVSEPCARAMAEGVRHNLNADIGISITGIAGPGGGTPEKPVGLVYIGLSAFDKITVTEHKFGHLRERNRERAASTALDTVRRYLTGNLE